MKTTAAERLENSTDMRPVEGTIDVDIPIDVLWECFAKPHLWSRWNQCFFWARNRHLSLGDRLIWCFQPIRWWFPYKMPAVAKIIELEPRRKVTWEVTAFPGFYAHHTYHLEDLGKGRTRFSSWEKAMGPGFRLLKWFWVRHFEFVKNRSMEGCRLLESIYRQRGGLTVRELPARSHTTLRQKLQSLLSGLSTLRLKGEQLAEGVHVVLGGGGNSLVINSENEVLVIDTKLPPFSKSLYNWIATHTKAQVTKIINTHYHFDHTRGNVLYKNVQIHAHNSVPESMLNSDGAHWDGKQAALPNELVDGTTCELEVGRIELSLNYSGRGHTRGDLWVFIQEHNILFASDLFFNGYYPFLDLDSEHGVSIPDMIRIARELSRRFPDAQVVPGHGPVGTVEDLARFADYMEFLWEGVEFAHKLGLSHSETLHQVNLSMWGLSILPLFYKGQNWITARSNISGAYRLYARGDAGRL